MPFLGGFFLGSSWEHQQLSLGGTLSLGAQTVVEGQAQQQSRAWCERPHWRVPAPETGDLGLPSSGRARAPQPVAVHFLLEAGCIWLNHFSLWVPTLTCTHNLPPLPQKKKKKE